MEISLLDAAIEQFRTDVAAAEKPLRQSATAPAQEGVPVPLEVKLFKMALATVEWPIVIDEEGEKVTLKTTQFPLANLIRSLAQGLAHDNIGVADFAALGLARLLRIHTPALGILSAGLFAPKPLTRQCAAHGLSYGNPKKGRSPIWQKDITKQPDGRSMIKALCLMGQIDPDVCARARGRMAYEDYVELFPELKIGADERRAYLDATMMAHFAKQDKNGIPGQDLMAKITSGRTNEDEAVGNIALAMIQLAVEEASLEPQPV